jgi:hypothetical protein
MNSAEAETAISSLAMMLVDIFGVTALADPDRLEPPIRCQLEELGFRK